MMILHSNNLQRRNLPINYFSVQMKLYEEALQDMSLAELAGYPADLRYKLLDRSVC
jgi:hypothetical protein